MARHKRKSFVGTWEGMPMKAKITRKTLRKALDPANGNKLSPLEHFNRTVRKSDLIFTQSRFLFSVLNK
jgi:hypothetical protein